MKKIIIPFAGFYESLHDSAMDDTLRQMFSDDSGDCSGPFNALMCRGLDCIEWGYVRRAYAEEYAKQFADFVGLESLKFESLISPREYNFHTDRIFTWVSPEDILKMWKGTKRETLDRVCREMFTSRSGFCSHYSPDFLEWGHVDTWDHNQLSALLRSYMAQNDKTLEDQFQEFDLMEHARTNGKIEHWIYANGDGLQRLLNIRDYLIKRDARQNAST